MPSIADVSDGGARFCAVPHRRSASRSCIAANCLTRMTDGDQSSRQTGSNPPAARQPTHRKHQQRRAPPSGHCGEHRVTVSPGCRDSALPISAQFEGGRAHRRPWLRRASRFARSSNSRRHERQDSCSSARPGRSRIGSPHWPVSRRQRVHRAKKPAVVVTLDPRWAGVRLHAD